MVASGGRTAPNLSDAEVADRVRESFRRYRPLANYGTRSIRVEVADGVVTLSGNVPDEAFRLMAVDGAAAAEGVHEVRDRLVSDSQLMTDVAAGLRHHRELQPSRVRVTAYLGVVVLEGEVETAELARLAEARLKIHRGRTEPAIELLAASGAEFGEVDNSRPLEEVERLLEPTLRRFARLNLTSRFGRSSPGGYTTF